MVHPPRKLPPMPEIGYPESHYACRVKQADQVGDTHGHEASKVGQYITLGIDPHCEWESKVKYFRHALRRHCVPPRTADALVVMFYQNLGDLVRRYAGQEALRMASARDDQYDQRLRLGETGATIARDAEIFFGKLLVGAQSCPEHFNEEDWAQLKLLRAQWVPQAVEN